MFGNDKNITKNKLNILYFLSNVDDYTEDINLERAMIETDLLDYFSIKQYISELESMDFVEKKDIINKTYYKITSKGRDALKFFKSKTLGIETKKISKFIEENNNDINIDYNILGNFEKIEENTYKVILNIMRQEEEFFNMSFNVPSISLAEDIINNWKNNSTEKYANIIKIMMDKE